MSQTPEAGHATPSSPVDWIRKHLAYDIELLPDFCKRHGVDEVGQAALRAVYEKAITDLEDLPGDISLDQALFNVHYGARDERDRILNPPIDQPE